MHYGTGAGIGVELTCSGHENCPRDTSQIPHSVTVYASVLSPELNHTQRALKGFFVFNVWHQAENSVCHTTPVKRPNASEVEVTEQLCVLEIMNKYFSKS